MSLTQFGPFVAVHVRRYVAPLVPGVLGVEDEPVGAELLLGLALGADVVEVTLHRVRVESGPLGALELAGTP
jgi:hypothetical protein